MLSQRGKHLGGRLGHSQPRCRLPTHADPQARDRSTAERCGASATPMGVCALPSVEAIPVAEAVEKRCGASAVAIAQASSARDAGKIEMATTTTAKPDLMF